MSEQRAQRDRRLIQRTAALLSEDYPLDQLIARLCDALASELVADIVFVGLSVDVTKPLRIAGVSGPRAAEQPIGSFVAETAPAQAAYLAGTPIVLSTHEDFVAYNQRDWNAGGSALLVPVTYGERTLGVVEVLSNREKSFDEQDLRLLQAIVRYLGIAIRNQRADEPAKPRARRVAFAVAIAIVALLISAAIWAYTGVRAQQMVAEARSEAESHLQSTASDLKEHLEDSAQLAVTATVLFHGMPHDRKSNETTLVNLLRSAQSTSVWGVGVWYQPYAFSSTQRLYGPYAHREGGHIVITNEWMRKSYDFPSHDWYKAGIAANGPTVYTLPYFDIDTVYVSAVRAFYGNDGAMEGVITVDSILSQFESQVAHEPYRRSLIYVSSGKTVLLTSRDAELLRFARDRGVAVKNIVPIPRPVLDEFVDSRVGADPESFESVLPVTGWTVHLVVDRAVLFAEVDRFRRLGIVAIVFVWLLAVGAIVAMFYARRQAERALDLERQHVELTREIAERKKAEERLRERAYRDELTRLPNRAFLIGELQRCLEGVRIEAEGRFAVLFIDLDRFNLINDSLGHDTGDLLLAEIAHRLRSTAGPSNVIARLGGDEFVILLPDADNHAATVLADQVLVALRNSFSLSGHELFISASIGIALADGRYSMPEEILRDADAAMYEAKRGGRSTVRVFDQSMHTRALEALAMETDLRWGLARHEIFPQFQPIVSLVDGHIVGFEALARWNHPVRGRVAPDAFIPLAEQTGLVVEIDERILAISCETVGEWLREFPDIYVSVNASAAHLARVDDLAAVRRALEGTRFPPSALRLELTETAVMQRGAKSVETFTRVRDLGVGIMIDDFGTGYSSLGYLQRLPIEGLKIDRSFVGEMMHDEKANEIVRAILAIAKTLHLNVVAEGAETREEVEMLRSMGVEYAQGFYFSHPLDAPDALSLLRNWRDSPLKTFA
jgi:diguanylate cyclase (GGDEF)-like protein